MQQRRPASRPVLTLCAVLTALCLVAPMTKAADDESGQSLAARFSNSNFSFARGASNAPFLPLAFLDVQSYSDTEVKGRNGTRVTYNSESISQGAVLPILIGDGDAVFIGEYLRRTAFDFDDPSRDSFDVDTVGVPAGWMRQVAANWQAATFVMPMGHRSTDSDSNWSWQYLGGAFARWEQRDDLWWAFGFYFDLAPEDNFYIPYVGASWIINDRWTLNAIMPWPGIIYAPSSNWFFRFGASPSGASWTVTPETEDIALNINTWDLGLSAERRIWGDVWLGLEAGYGGLGNLALTGNTVEETEWEVGSNGYLSAALRFRPSVR